MKKYTFSIILYLGFQYLSMAQYTPTTTLPSYNTPTFPSNNWINQNSMMARNNYSKSHPNSTGGIMNFKHDYKIVLKNDTVIRRYTKIEISDSVHFMKIKINKKNLLIRPADTKEVIYVTPKGKEYTGFPRDTCWLFKMRSGKINIFTYLPENEMKYLVAMQKGIGGEIVAYTKVNIIQMVKDNDLALKFVETNELWKAMCIYNEWK